MEHRLIFFFPLLLQSSKSTLMAVLCSAAAVFGRPSHTSRTARLSRTCTVAGFAWLTFISLNLRHPSELEVY